MEISHITNSVCLRIFSILEEELSSTDLDVDGHELWNINFVYVSVAQLAAMASIISWATRIGAGPGLNSLTIIIFSGDHQDGDPFDKEGGTLAHAFFPQQVDR